jgi:hypothetical protein
LSFRWFIVSDQIVFANGERSSRLTSQFLPLLRFTIMAVSVPPAPALPLDTIYEDLCRNCLGARNASHLPQNEEFAE